MKHCVVPGLEALFFVGLAALVHYLKPPRFQDAPSVWGSAGTSFFNTLMITTIDSFRQVYEESTAEKETYVALDIVYVLGTDLLLWCMHYTLHRPQVFPYIHYYHHLFVHPIALNFASVHPLEMLTAYATINLLPMLLIPVNPFLRMCYIFALGVLPILEHGDGLSAFTSDDPNFHNTHHIYTKTNFGLGITSTFWDRLFGSYRAP